MRRHAPPSPLSSPRAAAGWGGEARINWALLQIHNHLLPWQRERPACIRPSCSNACGSHTNSR
ncbi:hypothetical protein CBM2637_B140081 [Cupriavidus taiwanensis]|uniref:Uncharacterized protein n=1 Tax=Cupriavidus neocaledonicus TaxID=1040979 RepID=A0A375HRL0_9BURK|nr:hypothetical protein CBM2637_B140081 [Cupriavidus taiwanensis]SPA54747.1 protein of unknown function [Cupriavidus taiwanensis]SPD60809.1 protein of unknown function [Cupriavidus neocaledonicus]